MSNLHACSYDRKHSVKVGLKFANGLVRARESQFSFSGTDNLAFSIHGPGGRQRANAIFTQLEGLGTQIKAKTAKSAGQGSALRIRKALDDFIVEKNN